MKPQITADQSRRARRALGITQAKLAQETGLNLTLIKHFETYRIDSPPQDFQTRLIAYYSENGVNVLEFTVTDFEHNKVSQNFVKSVDVARTSFLVSDKLKDSEIESFLERMDSNDERILQLLKTSTSKGFFGGHSEETMAESRELFAAMAENHMIFRCLQGRNLFDGFDPKSESETHLHLLHNQYAETHFAKNLLSEIALGKVEQTETTEEGE